jgi:endoglycosylceramidase
VVDTLTAHHLWVLLDFHQDVFTGMPAWATTPAAASASDVPPAELAGIGWAAAYASPRSIQQWEDWWADAPTPDGRGVIDAFGDGVEAVARRFAGSPNVIGIDLLNEPFAGAQFLQCVLSTCPDRYQQVAAAYSSLTRRVKAVAPDLPVWWEPFTFGAPYPQTAAPGPNVGYTFHAYCLGTDGGTPEPPEPAAVAFCNEVFAGIFNGASNVGAAWNAPTLLGEFGASASPLNATEAARLADQHLMSWMHWHHATDTPEVVRTQLVRTSAQATAGHPLAQSFDPRTGAFHFTYAPDHTITAPTSIVVPPAQYPDGYIATVEGGVVTSEPDAGRLTVIADPSASEVSIDVERARG